MFILIKNGHIESDEWRTLSLAESDTPQTVRIPVGPVLVPLPVWQARRAELIYREHEHGWPIGIWLEAEEGPETIEKDVDDFSVIAVKFDKFADLKDHTTARLLREKYGYKGELRAIGDLVGDRLAYQHRVGFDSFAVHANQKTATIPSYWFDRPTKQSASRLATVSG